MLCSVNACSHTHPLADVRRARPWPLRPTRLHCITSDLREHRPQCYGRQVVRRAYPSPFWWSSCSSLLSDRLAGLASGQGTSLFPPPVAGIITSRAVRQAWHQGSKLVSAIQLQAFLFSSRPAGLAQGNSGVAHIACYSPVASGSSQLRHLIGLSGRLEVMSCK